jgi:signal transduction histidine kinase
LPHRRGPGHPGQSRGSAGWAGAAAAVGFGRAVRGVRGVHWPHRPPGLRWPSRPHLSVAWVDVAWAAFSVVNLGAIVVFSRWETVPFHFIWISLTLLYGFRVWASKPTAWVLAVVMITTGAAISWDVFHGAQSVDELNEVPLMAAMFWLMVWHAQRRLAADTEREAVSQENARLLATQRRFLQDASHQLRTPITIALGHAELLAGELAGRQEARDIQVVVGELDRLRRLGERLLMIAASEDPDFLRAEPVALERFVLDVLHRWMPTSPRRWQLGRLDPVMVSADRERLGLAVDALLENAVRHTRDQDPIQLCVISSEDRSTVSMVVSDGGEGIAPAEMDRIFERFHTGAQLGASRGTGLGLALVRAVARAHGGEVRVRSAPGSGSEFEVLLPVLAGEDASAREWVPGERPPPEDGRIPGSGRPGQASAALAWLPPGQPGTAPGHASPRLPMVEDPWTRRTH